MSDVQRLCDGRQYNQPNEAGMVVQTDSGHRLPLPGPRSPRPSKSVLFLEFHKSQLFNEQRNAQRAAACRRAAFCARIGDSVEWQFRADSRG